jgi:hypothetical protein
MSRNVGITSTPMPPNRRAVCVANLKVPHGEGHNSACVCMCPWCRCERYNLDAYTCSRCAWHNRRDEHSMVPLDVCLNCGHDRTNPEQLALGIV